MHDELCAHGINTDSEECDRCAHDCQIETLGLRRCPCVVCEKDRYESTKQTVALALARCPWNLTRC